MLLSPRLLRPVAPALLVTALLPLPGLGSEPYPAVEPVLDTETTVLGQDFAYPAGDPHVTAVIVTMAPGEETKWHVHEVPLYGYVLTGTVVVDYGLDGVRTFGPGESWIEAVDTPHQGRNESGAPVRILAVFSGAEGATNTRVVDPPPQ